MIDISNNYNVMSGRNGSQVSRQSKVSMERNKWLKTGQKLAY